MADDELDSLYWAEPDAFTALRTKLAAEAKGRGDAAAAKRISAARKPTTAAWIVNRLALRRKDAKKRLSDLGDRLRAAHAEMDGERIRDLSAEQHKLIDELTRAALEAAEVKRPSAAVREDLAGTLQAAVADSDVAERLGRLAKPQRWSGFGLGEAAPASAPAKRSGTAAQRRLDKLKSAVTDAEQDKTEAADALARRKAERDEARAVLRQAERRLEKADAAYDRAERADRAAAESVKEAKAQLKRA
jgi:DNA repair exonuclease SbcCD ATPase subunit